MEGRLTVNGALISPDMGLLVTGKSDTGVQNVGLRLNYDHRGKELLTLKSAEGITLNRKLSMVQAGVKP